jgi:RsiW-degrading membrane proteinase PrsW (M82 family)
MFNKISGALVCTDLSIARLVWLVWSFLWGSLALGLIVMFCAVNAWDALKMLKSFLSGKEKRNAN